MRQALKGARQCAKKTQLETAAAIGISLRYYQKIEAGDREGKCALWDKLESLLSVPQRQLRENR